MLEAIENLLILQDRDLRIERLEEELEQIPAKRAALKDKTSSSQAALDAAKRRVMEIESRRKELELEVKGLKERIEKYSNQQLQTKKNEEYKALANEIENCKRQITGIEDREIECMEQTETAQKAVKAAQAVADEARREMDGLVGELDSRETKLRGELASFEASRQEIAGQVEDSARNRYQRLFDSKGGKVVVGIQHGVCGGCHMRLPTQIVVQVRGNQELITCPNCARILYYTRDMDMVVAE
ncbi:MAG TPA: hypothetical protein DCY13_07785 [Verrucomicrobiales bacterium]|nr:hypothetical protein [Verrucomicrobiales bacterium]